MQISTHDFKGAIDAQVEATFERVEALYRQLHQYPELPFHEHETSRRLAEAFPLFGNAEAGGFGGEDIPYAYWFIGATPAERWTETPGMSVAEKMRHLEMPHSPYYFPGNAVTMRTGIAALASGALAWLGG